MNGPTTIRMLATAATCLVAVLLFATPAGAAKRKTISKTINVEQQVPELGAHSGDGLKSSFRLGGKFRNLKVTDVNLGLLVSCTETPPDEGLCITGVLVTLKAPGGSAFAPIGSGYLKGNAMGSAGTMMTLDDQAQAGLSSEFLDPTRDYGGPVLFPPYAGTAKPVDAPMSVFEGGSMKGRWTLELFDALTGVHGPTIDTLHSWQLTLRGRTSKK